MAAGREARLRARRRPAHQPGGGGRSPRERDGHVVCESGAGCRARRAARPGAHEGCAPDPARAGRGNRPAEARRDGGGDRYADARAAEVPGVVGDGDLSANQIQVRVAHLGLDRTTNTPVVILQEQEGERVLPIWIGPAEASAIAMELAGVKFARPLTGRVLYGPTGRPAVRTWVVLHQVSLGGGGQPIDSTRTDARGAYALTIRRPDSAAIYVVSTWYAGIAYFSEPITPGRSSSSL